VHDGPSGLLELIDNNPVVCADEVGIPGPAGTLALIGLGPIVQAGILAEPPTMLTNAPGTPDDLAADLLSIDWSGGITLEREDLDLGGVYAATIIAVIQTPEDLEEIDDVYEERFGRSFFVRREESQEWDVALVKSRPEALYRLRIAPDAPLSLLTIQVMADRDGKCGASQFVHAMNIMCGFEESLGIAG
jgi:N-acetyl-gamma-glutamylphosphate reductase